MKHTNDSIQKYIGKSVNIKTDSCDYNNERVVRVDGDSVVTEYHHWLKSPEDGLLREHWITISGIESIQKV